MSIVISSGVNPDRLTVNGGETLQIRSGGEMNDATVSAEGVVSSPSVLVGSYTVGAGDSLVDVTVSGLPQTLPLTTLEIQSGGSALDLTVDADCVVAVDAGGVISGSTLSGDFNPVDRPNIGYTSMTVYGSAIGTVVGPSVDFVVSSGGYTSGSVLVGSDDTVLAGAVADASVVSNGCNQSIGSGAVDSGSRIESGGSEVLLGGSLAENVTVSSGGTLSIDITVSGVGNQFLPEISVATATTVLSGVTLMSGATISVASETVESGAVASIPSGVAASGFTVLAGGRLDGPGSLQAGSLGGATALGDDGGVVQGISIGDVFVNGAGLDGYGGQLTVESGGLAEDVSVPDGEMIIRSGGLAIGTTLYAEGAEFGEQNQYHGVEVVFGSAVATLLTSSTSEAVESGGISRESTIYGSETIFSGGSTLDDSILSGGVETVQGNGSASDTVVGDGGLENVYGADSGATVSLGGQQVVGYGGLAEQTLVEAGGVQVLSSGGTASSVVVDSGGAEVLAGGVASGVTVETGAGLYLVENVSSGQSVQTTEVTGTTVISGVTVMSGAFEDIASATVSSGGTLSLTQGGDALDVTVYGGLATGPGALLGSASIAGELSGASIGNAAFSASVVVTPAGVLDGVAVVNGEVLVSAGGAISATVLSASHGTANVTDVYGAAYGTTVGAGDLQLIEYSGRATGTVVQSGGWEVVAGGGQTNAHVENGGSEILVSSATASGVIVSSGGALFVDQLLISKGQTFTAKAVGATEVVSGATLSSGAIEDIVYTDVLSGGTLSLGPSGAAAQIAVEVGGRVVGSGALIGQSIVSGTASGVTIGTSDFAGAVLDGGTASNVTVANGALEVASGGSAVGTVLEPSSGQDPIAADTLSNLIGVGLTFPPPTSANNTLVYGRAVGTRVGSGAQQVVSSGGVASGTVVSSGGVEIVAVRGASYGVDVASGGEEVIALGATVSGLTVQSGAVLDLQGLAANAAHENSSGQLVLTDYGTVVDTIGLSGAAISQFAVESDGAGGSKVIVGAAPAISDDLLGHGVSDFLIENAAGAVVTGELGSGGQAAYSQVAALGPEWSFEGSGNFLNDGKTGFLIENTSGAIVVGEIGANGQAGYTQVGALGPEWSFEGTGDFLGEGHAQFLIDSTSGAVVVGNVTNGQASYSQVAALGPEWAFKGTGDFLGDGHAQFLIESTSGAVVVGDVENGQASYTQVSALGSEWSFEASGDFLGDGHDQFLIENTSGAVVVGDVENGQTTYTQVAGLGPQWKFVGAGDYSGTGQTSFLIENTATGALVTGTVVNGQAQYAQVGGLGSTWSFRG
jgi:autotransporter passenger strand-loop-strand repeat protein